MADVPKEYELLFMAILADGLIAPAERTMLAVYAEEHPACILHHSELLERAGWTVEEYERGAKAFAMTPDAFVDQQGALARHLGDERATACGSSAAPAARSIAKSRWKALSQQTKFLHLKRTSC